MHGSVGYSSTSHHGCVGSRPVQSMRYLWWTLALGQVFFYFFEFPLWISFNNFSPYSISGINNWWPVGRLRPAMSFYAALGKVSLMWIIFSIGHLLNKCAVFSDSRCKSTYAILYCNLLFTNFNCVAIYAMLSGSTVTTAWRVLGLRIEDTASRYGG
jgi:hypothetical protein